MASVKMAFSEVINKKIILIKIKIGAGFKFNPFYPKQLQNVFTTTEVLCILMFDTLKT